MASVEIRKWVGMLPEQELPECFFLPEWCGRGLRPAREEGQRAHMSVDDPADVPAEWHTEFKRAGLEMTFRALERRVNLNPPGGRPIALGTIIRALTGVGDPTNRVVSAISSALLMTPEKFHRLRGAPVSTPFVLPARASQLTKSERAAVVSIINAILDANGGRAAQQQEREQEQSPVNVRSLRAADEGPAAEGDEPPLDVDHVKNAARKTPPGHQKGQPDQGATSGDGNQEGPSVN